MEEIYKELLDSYPFLSYITYGGQEYIGIIQNLDDVITSIYDYGIIKFQDQKKLYLELGEIWWWESNRLVPINIFLKRDWTQFRHTLKTFNSKDVVIKYGPVLSLKDAAQKRSKKKSITLIRKIA
jgi:hypothetical protein